MAAGAAARIVRREMSMMVLRLARLKGTIGN
jgi:hypothetical protein